MAEVKKKIKELKLNTERYMVNQKRAGKEEIKVKKHRTKRKQIVEW